MDNLEQALLESENSLMLLSDEELITPINDILIINPETRLIEVPSTELLLGVFSENLVEKKYFKCPRIVLNNIDLYECFIFINYVSASGRIGSIQSENVELDETEQYILFDWDLTNNVFDKNEDSTIYFSVSAKQYLEDSEPVFATRKAQGKMYETINGTEYITQEHADIILQILAGMKTKVDLPKDEDGNLLVPEEGQTLLFKEDGTTYYGTPSSGGGTSFSGSAKDVTYDDTETKLGAENVQDAIGKLSEDITIEVEYDFMLLHESDGVNSSYLDVGVDVEVGDVLKCVTPRVDGKNLDDRIDIYTSVDGVDKYQSLEFPIIKDVFGETPITEVELIVEITEEVTSIRVRENTTVYKREEITIGKKVSSIETELIKVQKEKADKKDIPTKTSQLKNDSNFVTTENIDVCVKLAFENGLYVADKTYEEIVEFYNNGYSPYVVLDNNVFRLYKVNGSSFEFAYCQIGTVEVMIDKVIITNNNINIVQSSTEIIKEISKQSHWRFEKVDSIPVNDASYNVIYLVQRFDEDNHVKGNIYDEYIFLKDGNRYELIGSTDIDLSNVYQKSETYSKEEINALVKAVSDAVTALQSKVPTKTSQLTDDVGFAKQTVVDKLSEEKADQTAIPTKTSQLTNDSGFLTEKPTYTASEVGADAKGTAQTKVSEHNVSEESHSDIRLLISNLTTRINGILDSEDVDLDQLSELVVYIKANRTLIESVTTNKVNVSDIIDNLTTSVSNKPLSAKQGVQLKALIDAIIIPTNISAFTNDVGYLTEHQDLSKYAKQTDVDALESELEAEVTAREQAIADLNAKLAQQNLLFAEGDTQVEVETWLETDGDKTKVYFNKHDKTFWQYQKVTEVVEGGVAYTNLLPTAIDADGNIYGGDYNVDGVNDGYKTGTRISSSSGSDSTSTEDMCASGFIKASDGVTVRIQNTRQSTGVQGYIMTFNASKGKIEHKNLKGNTADNIWSTIDIDYYTYDSKTNTLTIPLTSANFGTGIEYFRFSCHMDDTTIVTVDEEIVEGGGTTTIIVEKWASTGLGLIKTNYDAVIANLINITNVHTEEIQELREMVESGQIGTDVDPLDLIRNWDAPIYDAHIPVYQLATEKTAKTDATNTPDAIYAMYDALMAKHPLYITKTDLGVCSDGVNHIYRYDFREPEPYHQSNMPWSETKTKAILVSGIHYEWAGIYGLYYALEEIAENPNLYDLRRNTHFIVIPVLNPYCTITANYNASQGVLNANGVQIHRNFEVGFIYPNESGYVEFGGRNHGGTEPLSEMETQCLDNIFKENTDSAFFLTCHNFDSPSETNGLGFIWASSATKYMCNMGYRLVDKMTRAWMDKYSDELEDGIADYRTANVTDDFIRLGHAHMSLTDGTETRQATKYGIQGNNVEICHRFYPHGTKANVEPSMSAFTLSRGAETYINFLLTACGVYDYKDKEQYYK